MDVVDLRGVVRQITIAGVVVREVEVVIEDEALHDDEVMRLVRRRRLHRPVVRRDDQAKGEQRRADEPRDPQVRDTIERAPDPVQRVRGEGEADEQVDRAELLVEDRLRDVGEEEPERRAEIQPEVPPQERSSLQPVEGRPDEPGEERGDDVRQGKPEPEERDGVSPAVAIQSCRPATITTARAAAFAPANAASHRLIGTPNDAVAARCRARGSSRSPESSAPSRGSRTRDPARR